ncbi:MAG: hypothetical protein RL632_188 [Bacteroidota bacterium]|jgi:hypothetical protein
MDLDQLHYDILRLKLRRAEVVLEKNDAIKCERYEKAADLRETERKIIDDLAQVQAKLMHYTTSLLLDSTNFMKKQRIHDLLIELNPVDPNFLGSCLDRIELNISELKLQRQAHLSNKDAESAESVILTLNEQLKLQGAIKHFLHRKQ